MPPEGFLYQQFSRCLSHGARQISSVQKTCGDLSNDTGRRNVVIRWLSAWVEGTSAAQLALSDYELRGRWDGGSVVIPLPLGCA